MISWRRNAGLAEPEFTLPDCFVATIRRKPKRAFESVGGKATGEVTAEVTGEVTGEVSTQPESLPDS